MASIVNASPQTYALGIQDASTRSPIIEPMALPSHLVKVYIFGEKGPSEPMLVSSAAAQRMYGAKSFDERSEYTTHQTILAKKVMATGSQIMVERLVPTDAAPAANLRLFADVLTTKIPDYERNADGSFKLDADGNRIPKAGVKLDGYKVKYVVQHIAVGQSGEDLFGKGTQAAGDQVDETTSVQSIRYPIMDFAVPHKGAYGNNHGVRIWAPTQSSQEPVKSYLIKEGLYPFNIACLVRPDSQTTPQIVETEYGEQYLHAGLRPGFIDKSMDTATYLKDVFLDGWQDLEPRDGSPSKYGPFGRIHVYQTNIDALLDKFYTAEYPKMNVMFSDFTGSDGDLYRFNMFGGCSSFDYPYHTFELVRGNGGVRLSENTTLYATGGSDGVMSEDILSELVIARVKEYANENSILQSDAINPESIIYDSGFTIEAKKALGSFIAIRKDTAVALSTTVVGEPPLSASEDSSRAVMLKAYIDSFPESEYYGTSVVRSIIVGRSGILIDSRYSKRLPVTIELAAKAAAYMGAGNGVWKTAYDFTKGDLRRVTMFRDLNVTFTPGKVRNRDWDNGMIWIEKYDLRGSYFPAIRTVYGDDTSVLISFITMLGCVELQKVGLRIHRQFTGDDKMTRMQLVEAIEAAVMSDTKDRFDDRFVIVPEVYFTPADNQRGYSWSLKIKIYANNMRTVQQLTIVANRIEDLAQSA